MTGEGQYEGTSFAEALLYKTVCPLMFHIEILAKGPACIQ